MKITILDGFAVNPGDLDWNILAPYGTVTVYDRTDSNEESIARIGDSEIVLVNKTPLPASVIEACPSIRMIGMLATGYNIVDVDCARCHGIPVCNVPCYSTASVAQFAIALLLEICHHCGRHNVLVHEGAWTSCQDFCLWTTPQMELAGKTLGIIGYGRIGQQTARIAQALGMRVITFSRSRNAEGEYVDLDTLLRESDVISLHCPLFPETSGIISRENIGKMKDGAILINTARGALLDEQAVADALAAGKLRGVAVDVTTVEPIRKENPLLSAPNCIITPHMAWTPIEARRRLLNTVRDNIRSFTEGNPQNVVNP
ncbi:MAG: D-2-hydroxyacid dehydrogenase [Oscillospiraceae bacterium]|nr:D-2-hydroxyacid dehydrogenase [Oscillospiraceae bacterium]